MDQDSNAGDRHDGDASACEIRLASRVSPAVDRRLRLLVLIQRRPLSHVLTQLLDQALPPHDELIDQLRGGDEPAGAVTTDDQCENGIGAAACAYAQATGAAYLSREAS